MKLAGVLKHLESSKGEENIVVRQILEAVSEFRSDLRASAAANEMVVRTVQKAVIELQTQTVSIYALERTLREPERNKQKRDQGFSKWPRITIVRSGSSEIGHTLNIDGEDFELPIDLDADAAAEIAGKYMRLGMSPAAAVAEVLKFKSNFMGDAGK